MMPLWVHTCSIKSFPQLKSDNSQLQDFLNQTVFVSWVSEHSQIVPLEMGDWTFGVFQYDHACALFFAL